MIKIEFNQNKPISKLQVITIGLSIITAISILAVVIINRQSRNTNQNKLPATSSSQQSIVRVAALGILEPQGDIIHLSATGANQRLAKLLVKEGEQVSADQIIAVMDNVNQYQASVENARAKVIVARSRLAQVQAGEESGQIEAQRMKVAETQAELTENIKVQQSVIASQEIELRKTQDDYERYKELLDKGAVSVAETEKRRLQVEIEEQKLQEAKANLRKQVSIGKERVKAAEATLDSLAHVKPTDILVAKAELNESLSQLEKAKVDLESLYVKAPVAGQILSINTRVGEVVGSKGIVDIGQTQQMYVIAEVYESDIHYVKIGQEATIVSEYGGFTGEIKGEVDQIGLQIEQPGIINDDPSAKADVRIVKVKIRLRPDDSERVRTLNKLQVRASIQIN
ncbi:HlyD family efflux transporter periplasmic adaptor subunit [Nostoc sp. FACHB-87]|uniref:HlyD family efflux transporter periplasmic adaptor subunit n=1 Tax=Nostocaceae TaxID=1162 RepID=UPI001687F3D6|nr:MULTISPECIES: HlyD family efflux transporter periplasmic adaptor subunit [Nostocaceae]MBD2454787.1 HlyD family efflux transporter periplasmic adaptor subunit [Nostoc sp. FACHB-87]MBD2476756.1 HlyD family efflux transporter periplasmic adaptor subunit [Anabaena sp. FACHB-83]